MGKQGSHSQAKPVSAHSESGVSNSVESWLWHAMRAVQRFKPTSPTMCVEIGWHAERAVGSLMQCGEYVYVQGPLYNNHNITMDNSAKRLRQKQHATRQ